ncbi:MAG: c-type cytochrome, partial [Myxococcota bacterium]
ASVYASNCASCHGDLGQGLIGPNLVDAFWMNGGDDVSIFETVSVGVPAKGMPPWESILMPEERVAVTAFLYSIRGTTPPNPKEPQGEEYVEPGTVDAPPAGE